MLEISEEWADLNMRKTEYATVTVRGVEKSVPVLPQDANMEFVEGPNPKGHALGRDVEFISERLAFDRRADVVKLSRQNTLDHYGAVLEYPGGAKVQLSHLSYSIPERRFSGSSELVFCERAGVDVANAMAWDSCGKSIELCRTGGKETHLAMDSFLDSLLEGRRPEADIEVAYP